MGVVGHSIIVDRQRAYRAHIGHPIGEGRGQAPPFRGILVLIISVIMTTGVAQQLPARILAGAGAGASGAQAIRSPPDPPPEGGRGARTRICIDTYLE